MKAHFFTHSGQGSEPYVWHDPPLVFNVERDPGEKEPVTAKTWDGVEACCAAPPAGPGRGRGRGACSKGACLAQFIAEAAAAVAAKHKSVVWCEHCAADGVKGRSMLSASVDWTVMDCRGLSAQQSRCCTSPTGSCA